MILEALKALFIGIVEGITEWLPISSTGHMILVDEFVKLDVSDQFLALFLVVIQLGAIMAVTCSISTSSIPSRRRKRTLKKRGTWRLWGHGRDRLHPSGYRWLAPRRLGERIHFYNGLHGSHHAHTLRCRLHRHGTRQP